MTFSCILTTFCNQPGWQFYNVQSKYFLADTIKRKALLTRIIIDTYYNSVLIKYTKKQEKQVLIFAFPFYIYCRISLKTICNS